MSDPTVHPLAHLRELMRDYPGLPHQVDAFRAGRGSDLPMWPGWCLLPVGAWAAIAAERAASPVELGLDIMRLAGIGTWRYTQGVYAIDPDVLAALADTPLNGPLPSDVLLRLPEWAVYGDVESAVADYLNDREAFEARN